MKILTCDDKKPVAWTTMPDAQTWDFVSGSDNPNGKLSGIWMPLYTVPVVNRTPDAHELWAAAQLVPGESIIDGVMRIEEMMAEVPAASTAAGGRHDF